MAIKKAVVKELFQESIQALCRNVKLLSTWSNICQHETRVKGRKLALTDDIALWTCQELSSLLRE